MAQNNRPLETEELKLAGEGLRGYCDKTEEVLTKFEGLRMQDAVESLFYTQWSV